MRRDVGPEGLAHDVVGESRAAEGLEHAPQAPAVGVCMTVVLLTADYPPDVWSGIGVAVHRQATDLAALGARVTVVVAGRRQGTERGSNPDVVTFDVDGSVSADLEGVAWLHLHSLALTELALDLRCKLGAK